MTDPSPTPAGPAWDALDPRAAAQAGPGAQPHPTGAQLARLIGAATAHPALATAVVHPCDDASLGGALDAAAAGLILPILVGPQARIRAAAARLGHPLDGIELIDTPHSHAAAAQAVALARQGRVHALMKGALHTDELMAAILDPGLGLRTDRRMTHVFAIDAPYYPKPLFITDAAINIAPDLATKQHIVQNAIELAHALSIPTPLVAILAAIETVNPAMQATVDAAALCKMADRGQITGGLVDGPLAFDNAVSLAAAAAKGIASPVAGQADILVAPDLESGNMIAKQLVYLAGAQSAGIVLGAAVPVILTSRADGADSRMASCALAQLVWHHRQGGRR